MRQSGCVFKMKLIVGIDPGTTTAIALLDAESDYYHVFSQRNFSLEELCEYIVGYGNPIIVAADVEKAPDLVKKTATIFNARLFSPSEIMSINEKKKITEGKKLSNDHERDALSAALMAKEYYSGLFDKIDDVLENKNLLEISGDVKELIVKREVGNIEQAIDFLTEKESEKDIKVVYKMAKTKQLLGMEKKIKELQRNTNVLEKRFALVQKENYMLKKELSKGKPEEEKIINLRKSIFTKDSEIGTLKKEREDYRKIIEGGYEIIKKLDDEDVKDGVVLLEKPVKESIIRNKSPRAVIADFFLDIDIPIIPKNKIEIKKIGNCSVVKKEEIEKILNEADNFISWLQDYKEKRLYG